MDTVADTYNVIANQSPAFLAPVALHTPKWPHFPLSVPHLCSCSSLCQEHCSCFPILSLSFEVPPPVGTEMWLLSTEHGPSCLPPPSWEGVLNTYCMQGADAQCPEQRGAPHPTPHQEPPPPQVSVSRVGSWIRKEYIQLQATGGKITKE